MMFSSATMVYICRCKELCTRVNENDYPVAPPSHTPLPYGRYKVILCVAFITNYYYPSTPCFFNGQNS